MSVRGALLGEVNLFSPSIFCDNQKWLYSNRCNFILTDATTQAIQLIEWIVQSRSYLRDGCSKSSWEIWAYSHGWLRILWERLAGSIAIGETVRYEGNEKKMFRLAHWISKDISVASMSLEEKEQALSEVRILRSLAHACIIRYREAFYSDGVLHICMEFAAGEVRHWLLQFSMLLILIGFSIYLCVDWLIWQQVA